MEERINTKVVCIFFQFCYRLIQAECGKSKALYIKSMLPKGFKVACEFMSHNEKVYEYNGKYYSFDNTLHNGGVWKLFAKNGGRLPRIGTADKNLNIFKK